MRTLHQIIILVLTLTSALNVVAYQVTSDKAIEVVNTFRGLETDSGKYYFAQSDTLINNGSSTNNI